MEAKVQTYVRSLIDQNEKCKTFIRGLSNSGLGERAKAFLQSLDTHLFDAHDGLSTENEEEEDDDDGTGGEEESQADVAVSDI